MIFLIFSLETVVSTVTIFVETLIDIVVSVLSFWTALVIVLAQASQAMLGTLNVKFIAELSHIFEIILIITQSK
jgi:hypothetical protein